MATINTAKFLYFKTEAAYKDAKDSMAVGAIAFDAQGQHIYVKAAASGASKEYYIGDIVNNLTTDSSVQSLSAAQGKALKALIDAADSSISTIKGQITNIQTKLGNHDSSLNALDASSADYATRIGAIEVLDTKMQDAIVAVAKACAANELEGADKSVTVTPGSVDASTVDGSIMDGVVKAKIKVNLSGNTIKLDDTGLYVDGTQLTGIPQAGVTGLSDKLTQIDGSISDVSGRLALTDGSLAAEKAARELTDGSLATEKSERELADASLESKKVDKVSGKELIATDKITKLDDIEEKAQVNKIEIVKVNGEALTIDASKAVNVVIPAATVVGVKDGDKILHLDPSTKKLDTTLTINYDSTSRKVQLKGIDSSLISEFDASEFVKDGMLAGHAIATATATSQEITFSSGRKKTFTDLVVGKTYLFFEFSDGAKPTPNYSYEKLNVTQLVDVYTIDTDSSTYLKIIDHKIGAKVEVAHGLAGYDHLANVDASVADVSTKFYAFESSTNARLSSIETKNTQQDGSLADISTKIVTLNGDATVAGSVKKQIADASAGLIGQSSDASSANTIYGAKKWATEAAAKAAADVSISGSVSGDTLINSTISASGKAISGTVGATAALQSAVANANSAVQGVKVNGSALTKDSSTVNITIATGDASGNIKVNGTDVAVKGLQNAAYVTVASLEGTMDTKDTAVKTLLKGQSTDASTAETIHGAKNYAKAYTDAAFDWYVED